MKSTQCAFNAKLFFLGLCQYLHQPSDYDALSVQFLKNMGGVPFCLTNVPQSMFSLQCSNPAFGATGTYSFTDVSRTSSAKLAVKKLFILISQEALKNCKGVQTIKNRAEVGRCIP